MSPRAAQQLELGSLNHIHGDSWGPHGDSWGGEGQWRPMGTAWGPREDPAGTHGDPMWTHGDPMGTHAWGHGDPWGPHGDQREGHEDPGGPMGTMGGEKSFFTGAWPKPPPRLESAHKSSQHNSNLTLLKPTKQTRLNVDQSKRDSNLRHLASVRDWMLEPKGVQSTTSSKPLLSNAASVRDWVLQGSLLETQSPAVGVGVTLSRSLCFFLRLVALWFLLFDLKLSGICNP